MTAALALPTRRDEAWRYADLDALKDSAPAALECVEDIAVPAGEMRSEARIIADPASGTQIMRLRISIGEGATYALHIVNAGAHYARAEVEVILAEGAHFEFGGVTLGGGETTREFVTNVRHLHPHATSSQVVRSVHWGRATGNFLGRIEVARGAQKTDAEQSFKAMLLERGASANAKPELEIFADDVKCAHGATVGELDRQAAFYMASRGLPPERAQQLLIRAFIADAFAAMEDEAEQQRLLDAALDALEAAS
ncbi:MAG: SufD family Fe-S cluster assembly protein [Blastomonas sp.]